MTTNNLLRITQIDAIYLDREVHKIFLQLLQDCTKYLPLGTTAPYKPELNMLINMSILYYSIIKNSQTFGQKLLAIQYNNISTSKKVLYCLFNLMEYLKDKLELSSLSDLHKNVLSFNMFLKICSLINISVFLKYGTKPRLIERILGLDQAYIQKNVNRQFGSKYMTRELLWNNFIEILLYVLPLINYHKIKRIMCDINPFHKKLVYTRVENRIFTLQTCCAYCGRPPILPHHMGCAHIFCYSCLMGNQLADTKYKCPMCEYRSSIPICERVSMM